MNAKNTCAAALFLLLPGCGGVGEGALSDDEAMDALEQGVTALSDGVYVIKAVHSGKCLDVRSSGTADGVAVQQWDCNGTNAQKFRVSSVGDGFVKIENVNSNRAIDVTDVSATHTGQALTPSRGASPANTAVALGVTDGPYNFDGTVCIPWARNAGSCQPSLAGASARAVHRRESVVRMSAFARL